IGFPTRERATPGRRAHSIQDHAISEGLKPYHVESKARFRDYARAYFPRLKKRSFWSSLALSRTDVSVPTCASARLTASRAAILSAQALIVGYLPGSMASSSKLRSHGHAAMSAIVYSLPAT